MDTGNGRPHVYRNASDDRDERISARRLAQIFHVTALEGHVTGGDTDRFGEFLVRINFNSCSEVLFTPGFFFGFL